MKGLVYGIGVGPGDPELISIKAINVIKNIDVVICPEAKKGSKSIAFEIAKPYMKEDTEVVTMFFPMVYDKETLNKKWNENAEIIEKFVLQGKNVAFVTLGDPAIYSTYMYMVPYLKSKNIEVVTIPGITSFCSVAAELNIPICLWEETFSVVPLQKDCETARRALESNDNVIIMKPSHANRELAEILIEMGLENNFAMITKSSTDKQNIIRDINVLKNEKVPYMSTIIVKRKGI